MKPTTSPQRPTGRYIYKRFPSVFLIVGSVIFISLVHLRELNLFETEDSAPPVAPAKIKPNIAWGEPQLPHTSVSVALGNNVPPSAQVELIAPSNNSDSEAVQRDRDFSAAPPTIIGENHRWDIDAIVQHVNYIIQQRVQRDMTNESQPFEHGLPRNYLNVTVVKTRRIIERTSAIMPLTEAEEVYSIDGIGTSNFYNWSSFDSGGQETYETFLSSVLQCLVKGKENGINYYYALSHAPHGGRCVPLPSEQMYHAEDVSDDKYRAPPDRTIVSLHDSITGEKGGNEAIESPDSHCQSTINYQRRKSPSIHSRWLFDKWRLWEGELGCNGTCEADGLRDVYEDSKSPIPPSAPFITFGKHRGRGGIVKHAYRIDNFCVDEEDGSLITFKRARPTASMQINTPNIYDDCCHPMTTHSRFFDPSNQVVVENNATHASWREQAASALASHLSKQRSNYTPSVFFVGGPTLMLAADGGFQVNPGHTFHRIGSAMQWKQLLNITNMIFLTEMYAEKHIRFPPALKSGDNESVNSTSISRLFTMPPSSYNVPERKEANIFKPIPDIFAAAVDDKLQTQQALLNMYGPLLGSGDTDSCDSFRCQQPDGDFICSGESINDHRRCATPYIAVPVTAPTIKQLKVRDILADRNNEKVWEQLSPSLKRWVDSVSNNDVPFLSDTHNYSRSVWAKAVKMSFREAKAIHYFERQPESERKREQKGGEEVAQFILHNDDKILRSIIRQKYSYFIQRREVLFGTIGNTSPSSRFSIFVRYFAELFPILLEIGQFVENHREPASPKERNYICYRSAYLHSSRNEDNFRNQAIDTHQRGQHLPIASGNCNQRETLQTVYRSYWQHYGRCPKSSEKLDPVTNTNRDAHPIFTLPLLERRMLERKFSESKAAIDAIIKANAGFIQCRWNQSTRTKRKARGTQHVLRNDFTYNGFRPPMALMPVVTQLIREIDVAQKSYDDIFMRYFRSDNARTNSTKGRRIRIYIPNRSGYRRAQAGLRPTIAKLLTDGIADGSRMQFKNFIELQFTEGRRSDALPSSNLKTTARAIQHNAAMTTDLIIGPHGADLHVSAIVKPSCFITEIAFPLLDHGQRFNSGFFAPAAFSRNIGYLRVLAHRIESFPDRISERGTSALHMTMTLPEMRQLYSISVCAWLATNAVRLGDEDKGKDNFEKSNFEYIVPWWCRGGPASIVRNMIQAAISEAPQRCATANDQGRETKPWPQPSLRQLQAIEATLIPSYYTSRSVPSGYGFVVPYCVPIEPQVSQLSLDSKSTLIEYKHLIRVQNECARNLTWGTHSDKVNMIAHKSMPKDFDIHLPRGKPALPQPFRPAEAQRYRVEGLQSLLESSLFINPLQGQRLALAIVEGADTSEELEPSPSIPNIEIMEDGKRDTRMPQFCGEFSLNAHDWHFQDLPRDPADATFPSPRQDGLIHCMKQIVLAILNPSGRHKHVSPRLIATLNRIGPNPTVKSTELRVKVAEWVAREYNRIVSPPTVLTFPMPLTSSEFSYGANCTRWMEGVSNMTTYHLD